MIFNMTGGGAKKGGGILPLYSGACHIVVSEDGKSGYIEMYESGILAWSGARVPKAVDITCVGAGGGGSRAFASKTGNETASWFGPGAGGAGGFVVNVFGAELPEFVEVVIGAGGGAEATGGATSVGEACEAAGGTGATVITYYESYYQKTDIVGQKSGSGGNAGGIGYIRAYNGNLADKLGGDFAESDAAYGRSNGAQHTVAGIGRAVLGTSQGTPTTDILGRRHAGGGSAGRYTISNGQNKDGFAGGASDFTAGAGLQGGKANSNYSNYTAYAEGGYGGGGYGGGGGGGGLAYMNSGQYVFAPGGNAGGNGFAMTGWGDYLALYEAQNA